MTKFEQDFFNNVQRLSLFDEIERAIKDVVGQDVDEKYVQNFIKHAVEEQIAILNEDPCPECEYNVNNACCYGDGCIY